MSRMVGRKKEKKKKKKDKYGSGSRMGKDVYLGRLFVLTSSPMHAWVIDTGTLN